MMTVVLIMFDMMSLVTFAFLFAGILLLYHYCLSARKREA